MRTDADSTSMIHQIDGEKRVKARFSGVDRSVGCGYKDVISRAWKILKGSGVNKKFWVCGNVDNGCNVDWGTRGVLGIGATSHDTLRSSIYSRIQSSLPPKTRKWRLGTSLDRKSTTSKENKKSQGVKRDWRNVVYNGQNTWSEVEKVKQCSHRKREKSTQA